MSDFIYTLNKKYDKTFTVSFISDNNVEINNYLKLETGVLNNINKITSYYDEVENESSTLYVKRYFKYKNGNDWSDLKPISDLSGLTVNACQDFELQLFYYETNDGDTSGNKLYINDIIISGEYELSEFDNIATITYKDEFSILKPNDIYKIFSISDFQVISNHNYYDIKYRITQDNGRHYTEWESLTKENISTVKINPIRFAQIEYLITNLSTSELKIYDIIIEGDFQNISANYLKTNRYGLKEDCIISYQQSSGMAGSSNINRDFYTSCLSTYSRTEDITQQLNYENSLNSEEFWNPYDFTKITQFTNMLGNQVSSIFGWTVDYYLTDPDSNGIDTYLHEYTLKNTVDLKKIKIIVPENKFPVQSLIVNQFSLDLFDTFEIHIMKDDFKNAFGITKRPSEDDYLYICETNMVYYVKHAQAYNDIMNASTYYKVILEKYEYKTSVSKDLKEARDSIDALTNNTTLEQLFGEENIAEEAKVANKTQMVSKAFDKIRYFISKNVDYIDDVIFVDGFEIVKTYYDLSSKYIKNKNAITYKTLDNNISEGDNRTFMFWFKFKDNYDETKSITSKVINEYSVKRNTDFDFLTNYESGVGYKIHYKNDYFIFEFNDKSYSLNTQLKTNIWYIGNVTMNQRQNTLNMKIYKRDINTYTTIFNKDLYSFETYDVDSQQMESRIINDGFVKIHNFESGFCNDFEIVSELNYNIEPNNFTHNADITLNGSNINYTNLRIFNNVYNDEQTVNLMKEHIIKDSQYLILGDNGDKQLQTTLYWNKSIK